MAGIIWGALWRLAICAVFFTMAYYVLRADIFPTVLGDMAERFDRERDTFNGLLKYRTHMVKGFYGLSAIFFILFSWFLYTQIRPLHVRPIEGGPAPYVQPGRQYRPYNYPYYPRRPGNYYGYYGSPQPYGSRPAQPYSRPSYPYGSSSQGVRPYGGAQPYSRPTSPP